MNLMKTTKILKLLLVIFLCVGSLSTYAQKEDYNEQCKRNLQIEKEIQALVADTITLHQTIEKFDAEQQHLNAQIDSIAKLCNELKSDVDNKRIAVVQHKVDSLSDVVKKLQERKQELISINRKKESSLSELNRNISGMGAFSEIKDEQTYAQYQETLLRPFSEITIKELDEIDSKLKSFSKQPDYSEFYARLISCKKSKELYDAAESLLNSQYDADKIKKTRDKLYELLDIKKDDLAKGIIKLSDKQYSEIDTLDIKLSRYGDGIAVLQEIIKTVNGSNIRDQYQGQKVECIEALRSIVISDVPDDVEKRQRYFDMIPSLKNLYRNYWKELQANPFEYPTVTETLIMQLNNE